MRAQEIFDRLRHEVRSAECVGQGGFECGRSIIPLAVGNNQCDRRLAGIAIETAGFVAVLPVAVIDYGPVAFFPDNQNGAEEVVAFRGRLLEHPPIGYR